MRWSLEYRSRQLKTAEPKNRRTGTNKMRDNSFIAERLSRSAAIIPDGNIERVFPFFGPIEKMKWAEGWEPAILYPTTGKIEEELVFTTRGHGHGEDTFAWMVSKYRPEIHLVEYVVSTQNRYCVINIRCKSVSGSQSEATVSYTYTGLNDLGNEINRHAIEKMYERDLKDWEEVINHFLKTGKKLKHN